MKVRRKYCTLEAYSINYRRKKESEEAENELLMFGRALNLEATDNCHGIKQFRVQSQHTPSNMRYGMWSSDLIKYSTVYILYNLSQTGVIADEYNNKWLLLWWLWKEKEDEDERKKKLRMMKAKWALRSPWWRWWKEEEPEESDDDDNERKKNLKNLLTTMMKERRT